LHHVGQKLCSVTKGRERKIKNDMEFVTKNVKDMASYKAQGDDAVIQGYIHKRTRDFGSVGFPKPKIKL